MTEGSAVGSEVVGAVVEGSAVGSEVVGAVVEGSAVGSEVVGAVVEGSAVGSAVVGTDVGDILLLSSLNTHELLGCINTGWTLRGVDGCVVDATYIDCISNAINTAIMRSRIGTQGCP